MTPDPSYLQQIGFNRSNPATKQAAPGNIRGLLQSVNFNKRTPMPPPPGMKNAPKFSDMNPWDGPQGGPFGKGMGQMPSYEGRMGGIGGMPQYGSNPMQQGGMSSPNPFDATPYQALLGEMYGGNPFQTSSGGKFGGNPNQPSYGGGFGGNPYQPYYGGGIGSMPRPGYSGGGFGGNPYQPYYGGGIKSMLGGPPFQNPSGGGFGFQGNYGNPGYSYGCMPFQGNSPYGKMSGGQAVNTGSPNANPFGSFATF